MIIFDINILCYYFWLRSLPRNQTLFAMNLAWCRLYTPGKCHKISFLLKYVLVAQRIFNFIYNRLSGNRGLTSMDGAATQVPPHPAAAAELQRGEAAQRAQSMQILRATQGLHAPLRLAMEAKVMQRMSPRLPGIYAHHPLAAQLSGDLDTIDFCNILNSMFNFVGFGIYHDLSLSFCALTYFLWALLGFSLWYFWWRSLQKRINHCVCVRDSSV